jgi:hypothetical protein
MLKINTKVDISLKQGNNSINAACSAEFELSEDITEKEQQSLEQVSKLIAKTAANTINETLKSKAASIRLYKLVNFCEVICIKGIAT